MPFTNVFFFELSLNLMWFLSFKLTKLNYFLNFYIIFITLNVSIFKMFYMQREINLLIFNWIFFSFVLTMLIFINSYSLFTFLIGWDGLGVTSFFLVLFYSTIKSTNASILTFLTNRLGDIFFIYFISLTWYHLFMGSDNKFTLTLIHSVLLCVCIFTKSAQYPFMVWLPAAMEAPTPVSALVHSSTLVVAGVVLFMNFNQLMQIKLMKFMMMSSFVVFILGSSMSLMEMDLKKLIALSTLNQMAFIFFCLCNNFVYLACFHLIVHALFKSCLFVTVGIMMHSLKSTQDYRSFSLIHLNSLVTYLIFMGIFHLIGWPFVMGFYTKDLILDNWWMKTSFLLMLMSYLFVYFTFFYCLRLLKITIWYNLNQITATSSHSLNLNLIFVVVSYWVSFFCFLWFNYFNFIFFNLVAISYTMKLVYLTLMALISILSILIVKNLGSYTYFFSSFFFLVILYEKSKLNLKKK